jgi:hypothetical protein
VVTRSPKKQFYVTFRQNVFPQKKATKHSFSENYLAFEDFLPNKNDRFVTDPFFWMHLLTRM